MAKQHPQKSTPLQWLLVGIVSFTLICMACGVIGLLANATGRQAANVPTIQLATTTTPEAVDTTDVVDEPERAEEPNPTATRQPTTQVAPDRQMAQIVDVIDGDTLKVMLEGQEETIRLIGIDTPESVHPQKPVECFGREAATKTQELSADQTVQLEADPTQDSVDRYGRLLRYVYLPGDKLLNWELIYQGYAFEYTYNIPYAYQTEFQQAEQDARENQRGLWAPDACNGERKPAEEPKPQPEPEPTQPPIVEEQPPQPAGNCDPAYTGVCIPPPPPDLNCPEIREQYGCSISVVSHPDPHNLDRDKDGIACECQN